MNPMLLNNTMKMKSKKKNKETTAEKIAKINAFAKQRIEDKEAIGVTDYVRIENDRLRQIWQVEHPFRGFFWKKWDGLKYFFAAKRAKRDMKRHTPREFWYELD